MPRLNNLILLYLVRTSSGLADNRSHEMQNEQHFMGMENSRKQPYRLKS